MEIIVDLSGLVAGQTILFVSGMTKHEPIQEFDLYVLVTNVRSDGFDFANSKKGSVPSEELHLTNIRVVDESVETDLVEIGARVENEELVETRASEFEGSFEHEYLRIEI